MTASEIDLRFGRWEEVLGDVECDLLLVDAPYSERTHEHQQHGRKTKDPRYSPDRCLTQRGLTYDALTVDDVNAFVHSWVPRTRGWFVSITDSELYPAWRDALREAGRYVFAPLACVQTGMNVRLAGDGPSNWTVWAVVARPRVEPYSKWGTLRGAYVMRQDQERKRAGDQVVHGAKPLWLMQALVRDYSRPGDLVCDAFAGSGTTLLAAAIEGRRAVGAEMDRAHFEIAQKRIGRGYTPSLFYRRTTDTGADTMPRKKKTENETLAFPDELNGIAEKYRKALAPLADREEKLVAELALVRAKRVEIDAALRPLEKIIAEQRTIAEARAAAAAPPASGTVEHDTAPPLPPPPPPPTNADASAVGA